MIHESEKLRIIHPTGAEQVSFPNKDTQPQKGKSGKAGSQTTRAMALYMLRARSSPREFQHGVGALRQTRYGALAARLIAPEIALSVERAAS
jgi:hypothetical protein